MPFKDPIKRKEYQKKYRLDSKERKKQYDREYYYLHKEKRKKIATEWIKNNPEQYKIIVKRCYNKNKKSRIKRQVEYEKKRLKVDYAFKLKKRLRTRLRDALRGKAIKSKKTLELLGIPDFEFFLTWMESKFKEGMNWQNIRLWHIDHIIPCSHFDLTKPEEQAKCFHYTNLQPLWASENLSKGNRIS